MPENSAVAAREAAQNQAARAVHHIMAEPQSFLVEQNKFSNTSM